MDCLLANIATVKHLNFIVRIFTSGGMPEFIEDDVFRTIIPLTSVAVEKIGPREKTQVKT